MNTPLGEKSSSLILLVDDAVFNLKLLTGILTGAKFRVQTATNGEIALSLALREKPDLILLDVNMPDMDGYEVCRRLKAEPETSRVPVIFISALDAITDKLAGFKVGGVDYITKPFQPEEVLARVRTHISLNVLRKQLGEKQEEMTKEIARRKKAELEAERAAIIIEQLINGIPAIMVGITPDGIVSEWNPGAENAFNIPVESAMDQNLHTLPIQWDWRQVDKGISRCLQYLTIVDLESVYCTLADGRDGILSLRLMPILNGMAGLVLFGAANPKSTVYEGDYY